MGEKLISEGGDVLEHGFSQDALEFTIYGESFFMCELPNLYPINTLNHKYIEPKGKDSFQEVIQLLDTTFVEASGVIRNLYSFSPVYSSLCVIVPNETLEEFSKTISSLFLEQSFAACVKYMTIKDVKSRLPTTHEEIFGYGEHTLFGSPTFVELTKFGEEYAVTQMFNSPSPHGGDYHDESVATFYGDECDWKAVKFDDEKFYFSMIPTWWEYNSKLLMKYRIGKKYEDNDLANSVSLNRSAITEISWEIARIKNQINLDDELFYP